MDRHALEGWAGSDSVRSMDISLGHMLGSRFYVLKLTLIVKVSSRKALILVVRNGQWGLANIFCPSPQTGHRQGWFQVQRCKGFKVAQDDEELFV